MKARMVISSGWIYVALGAAVLPVALIIMFLAAGNAPVAGELAILLAIFAAVMALGTYTAVTSRSVARTPAAVETGYAAWEATLGIEWIDEVPPAVLMPLAPVSMPVSMTVVKVTGSCIFGFKPGDKWVIDANGHLSRPMCAVAVKAFSSLPGSPREAGLPQEAACSCPLAGREVVFAMETEEEN